MRAFVLSLFVLLASCLAALAGETKTLTLEQAVSLALENNNSVRIYEAKADEAEALTKSTIARFGPSFSVDAFVMQWNEAYDIDILQAVDLPNNVKGMLDAIVGSLPPIELRAAQTEIVSVTAIQPLTPLYSVYQGYQARSAGEAAMQSMSRRTKQEVTFKTVEAYYRVLAVAKLNEVAEAAVKTVLAHVDQAREYEKAEFIGKNEILTAELELANYQEMQIRARSGLSLAKSALAQVLGVPLDTEFKLLDDAPPVLQETPFPLAEAQQHALSLRGDLGALRQKAKAMDSLEKLAYWQMTPTIAAIGHYQYSNGIILFEENEMFAGLSLTWNFWEWGRKYHEAKAAGFKARQAHLRENEVTELVQLQVKQKYLELDAARQRFVIGDKAVSQAEENLRLQQLRFQEGLATSVNVIDAQTLLTRAKSNQIAARYDLLTNYAALMLAVGQNPLESKLPAGPAGAPGAR